MTESSIPDGRPLPVQFLFRFFFVFVLVFVHSFSFPHALLPDVGKLLSPFFEVLAGWTAQNLFGSNSLYSEQLVSDSPGLYAHAFNVLLLSALAAAIWTIIAREKQNAKLVDLFFAFVRYYLALQLLSYGFNKVFKLQFYLPEPNTLFTTVGNTPRDMLYWSTMGVSRTYTVFSGLIELLAAGLLLFRRTQLAGAIVAAAVLTNVLLINVGFDISVKLYSAFLLLLSFVLLAPDAKRLLRFFSGKATEEKRGVPFYASGKWKRFYLPLKFVLAGVLLLDSCINYFRSGNFNDDTYPRPPLHGAYDVTLFNSSLALRRSSLSSTFTWKRVFIHRRNYFIVQYADETMEDFQLVTDTTRHKLFLPDIKSTFDYEQLNDSMYVLNGVFDGDSLFIQMKKVKLEELPIFRDESSWVSDPE